VHARPPSTHTLFRRADYSTNCAAVNVCRAPSSAYYCTTHALASMRRTQRTCGMPWGHTPPKHFYDRASTVSTNILRAQLARGRTCKHRSVTDLLLLTYHKPVFFDTAHTLIWPVVLQLCITARYWFFHHNRRLSQQHNYGCCAPPYNVRRRAMIAPAWSRNDAFMRNQPHQRRRHCFAPNYTLHQ
jgi:hypothetical protein